MRNLILVLGTTVAIGAFASGCGDDETGGGGGAGGAGGASTTTSGATTGGTTTGGTTTGDATTTTGGGGEGGEGTTSVTTGGEGGSGGSSLVSPSCDAPPAPAPSGGECIQIGGTVECNPITNEGCGEDEWCDVIEVDTYICFPLGDQGLCEECNTENLFCAPGSSCTTYFSALNSETEPGCAAYCCSDDDCAEGSTCQTVEHPIAPQLGLCLQQPLD